MDNLGVALAGGDIAPRGEGADYCGGYSDPTYAASVTMSSSSSFSTTGFICCAASSLRVPFLNASSCRSR